MRVFKSAVLCLALLGSLSACESVEGTQVTLGGVIGFSKNVPVKWFGDPAQVQVRLIGKDLFKNHPSPRCQAIEGVSSARYREVVELDVSAGLRAVVSSFEFTVYSEEFVSEADPYCRLDARPFEPEDKLELVASLPTRPLLCESYCQAKGASDSSCKDVCVNSYQLIANSEGLLVNARTMERKDSQGATSEFEGLPINLTFDHLK